MQVNKSSRRIIRDQGQQQIIHQKTWVSDCAESENKKLSFNLFWRIFHNMSRSFINKTHVSLVGLGLMPVENCLPKISGKT